MNPKITVLVTTHKRHKALQVCLESLAAQSDQNFKTLVVSDLKDDIARSIVSVFSNQMTINYIETTSSIGGPSLPRNIGITKTDTEYIAFLDDDDIYLPSKIKILNLILNSRSYDLIFHPLIVLTSPLISFQHVLDLLLEANPRLIGVLPGKIKNLYRSLFWYGNYIATSSVVISRKLVLSSNLFNESKDLLIGEDYDLWLRVARQGISFFYHPQPLGFYLMGSGISSKPSRRLTGLKRLSNHFKGISRSSWFIHSYLRSLLQFELHEWKPSIKSLVKVTSIFILLFFAVTYRVFFLLFHSLSPL